MPDQSGQLEAYAREIYDACTDNDWPFADDPDVEGGCCVHMTVAWDSWVNRRPRLHSGRTAALYGDWLVGAGFPDRTCAVTGSVEVELQS